MTVKHYIENENLSRAWARAFLATMEQREILPLIVTVTGFADGRPQEDANIRRLLDVELTTRCKQPCHTVANTIFPASLWSPSTPRHQLYDRYNKILPRLKKKARVNRNGLYFERLIAHGSTRVNQLEHVIETWQRGDHRRSALVAAVLDPACDHTHQRQRGFPCLQQVSFTPEGTNGLAITGFLSTQYLFARAYGNYLGLCRLGEFLAHELGLTLCRMTCIAGVGVRDVSKRNVRELASKLESALDADSRPLPPVGSDVKTR